MPKTNNLTQFIHYRHLYGKSAPPPLIWQLRSQSPQTLLRTLLTSEKAAIVAFQNPDISGKLSFEEMIDVFAAHPTLVERVTENRDLFERLTSSNYTEKYLAQLLSKNPFLASKIFEGFYEEYFDLIGCLDAFEIFYKDFSVYFNQSELFEEFDFESGHVNENYFPGYLTLLYELEFFYEFAFEPGIVDYLPGCLSLSLVFKDLQTFKAGVNVEMAINGLHLAALGHWHETVANEIINTPRLCDKITGNQWVIFGYPHVNIANQIFETPMLLNQVNPKGRAMLGQKHFSVGNKILDRKEIYREFSIQDFRILSGIDLDRENYHNQIFSLENFPWDFRRENRLNIIKKIFSCLRFKELLPTDEALDFLDILCEHYIEVAHFIFSEKSSLKNRFKPERQNEILNNHFIRNHPIEKTFPQWKNKSRAISSSSLAFICRNYPNHAKAIYIALTNARLFNDADFEVFSTYHELARTFLPPARMSGFGEEFYTYPLTNIKNMLNEIELDTDNNNDGIIVGLREITSIWEAFQNLCGSIEPKKAIQELSDEELETVVGKEEEISTPRPGL